MNESFSNPNAYITTVLCSKLALNNKAVPLSYEEWAEFNNRLISNRFDPSDILELNDNRILEILNIDFLTKRRISNLFSAKRLSLLSYMTFILERNGIYLTTVYDCDYPERLTELFGVNVPPILYYAGNINLLNERLFGVVCTHNAGKASYAFADKLSAKIYNGGYTAALMGTDGTELYLCDSILKNNGKAVIWVCNDMLTQYRNRTVLKAIEDGRLLIVSDAIPTAHYNPHNANMRNKCFYSLCDKAVVIKTEYKFGGAWFSALNALKMQYTSLYCYNNSNYPGNMELIRLGAKAIDKHFKF